MESSLQKHPPQQSPFYLTWRLISQTINAVKMVILVKYSIRTPKPLKKQKLAKASREEVQPKKKAMAFVNDVIVIDEPACIIPFLILCSIESLGLV